MKQKLIKKIYQFFRYQIIDRHFFAITGPLRVLPSFIVIGVKRCGTTSLYEQLDEHPCIKKSAHDNLGFFNNNFDLGLNWYRSHFPSKFSRKRILREYGKFLSYDVTSTYIQNPKTAENILKTIPDVKLIVILRNPIDRAYSEYNQNIIDISEKRGFEELISEEMTRIEHETDGAEFFKQFSKKQNNLIRKSMYAKQLSPWLEKFPKKQILILSTEDFGEKTTETYNKIFQFLGISFYEIKSKKRFRKGNYSKLEGSVRSRLQQFFGDKNEKLFDMIDENFNWK